MRRRLPRILLNAATAVSLVLWAAAVALWARSYVVTDRLFWQTFEDTAARSYWTQTGVRTGRGGIGVNRVVQSSDPTGPYGPVRRQSPASITRRNAGFYSTTTQPAYPDFRLGVGDRPVWGGFKLGAFAEPDPARPRPRRQAWQLVVPFWAIVLMTAALPAVWAWRWLRNRRRAVSGLCPSCGYDLRATPDRCPECGTIPVR